MQDMQICHMQKESCTLTFRMPSLLFLPSLDSISNCAKRQGRILPESLLHCPANALISDFCSLEL